jgi:hypothetical protein
VLVVLLVVPQVEEPAVLIQFFQVSLQQAAELEAFSILCQQSLAVLAVAVKELTVVQLTALLEQLLKVTLEATVLFLAQVAALFIPQVAAAVLVLSVLMRHLVYREEMVEQE